MTWSLSVRECMLFLIREIQRGNHRATNPMNATRWVGAAGTAAMAVPNEEMHIDKSSSSSSEPSDRFDQSESEEEEETELSEAPSDLSDAFGESEPEQVEDTELSEALLWEYGILIRH
jgi:hypothetical protein